MYRYLSITSYSLPGVTIPWHKIANTNGCNSPTSGNKLYQLYNDFQKKTDS